MYRSKRPKNKLDLMIDVSEIMAGYCNEDDNACKGLAYEATMKEFHSGPTDPSTISYPERFHSGLKNSIDDMFNTIELIDGDNIDEVVYTLEAITIEMKNIEDVNFIHQAIALSAISIALESTKFWHKVYFGSESHPLRKLQGYNIISTIINTENSDLGLTGVSEDIYISIIADTSSALNNGINFLEIVGTDSADAIMMFFPIILITVFYFAVPASANAFFRQITNTNSTLTEAVIGGP